MTDNIKCYRCGKEFIFNYKNITDKVKCDHCNGVMILDESSKRKVKYVRYVIMLFIALIISYGMMQFKQNNYVIILVEFIVLLSLVNFIDKFCLYLAYKIFNLKYIEYHPEEVEKAKRKANVEKQRKKNKGK